MFSLIQNLGFRKFLRREASPLVLSMVIAELFFRFHSFTLECVSFLATWYAISLLASVFRERLTPIRSQGGDG
jgi:hypothetical protein